MWLLFSMQTSFLIVYCTGTEQTGAEGGCEESWCTSNGLSAPIFGPSLKRSREFPLITILFVKAYFSCVIGPEQGKQMDSEVQTCMSLI
jgi:hypothetical protein